MRFLSLCSGIEAASVAWKDIGWEAAGFAEIEPFPSAVLAHHFPNTKNHGDITKYDEWGIAPGSVDLICGGPPCQAFSIAGQRGGMADPRGNLTLTYVNLVKAIRPRWIIYENVPGLLSSNGGRDFAAFVQALVDGGYCLSWRTFDAQRFGIPQRRKRVFVVGYLGDWRPPAEVLSFSDCLRRNPPPRKGKGEGSPSQPVGGLAKGCFWDGGQVSQCLDAVLYKGQTMPEKNRFPAVLQPVIIDRAAFNQGENALYDPKVEVGETMSALVARGPHAVAVPVPIAFQPGNLCMNIRRLTPLECERLQGFPDNWTRIPWRGKSAEDCPDGPRYKAIGNSWAVPVARWIGENIARYERGERL